MFNVTFTKEIIIDFDIGIHSVYWAKVTAEYSSIYNKTPIAIYNSKGRKLPHLLRRIIDTDNIDYLVNVI